MHVHATGMQYSAGRQAGLGVAPVSEYENTAFFYFSLYKIENENQTIFLIFAHPFLTVKKKNTLYFSFIFLF